MLLAFAGGAAAASVAIVAPAQDETIHDNSGNVSVSVEVDDAPGAKLRLLLDGRSAAPEADGTELRLENIDRGAHSLQAELIGPDGNVLAASAPVTFYLWRASRLFPNRHGN